MYPDLQTVKQIDGRGVQACLSVPRDSFRYVYAGRGDADFEKPAADTVICWRAPARKRHGRYSFLGYDPTMEITCLNGEVTIRENLGTALRQ